MAGIDETLKKMGLDYLDMMIIHSPQPWAEVNQSQNRYEEGNREAWRALEDAYKAGKLKAIGVSNFQIGDIENLIKNCEIKPMVNQILLHISNTPTELVDYCQKNGIVVEAIFPNRSRGNLKAAGNCCNGRKVWSNRSTALHSVYDTAWRSIPAEDGKSGAYENKCRG